MRTNSVRSAVRFMTVFMLMMLLGAGSVWAASAPGKVKGLKAEAKNITDR